MSNFIPVLFILCIGLLTIKTRAHQSSFNRFEKTWSYPRIMGQFLFGFGQLFYRSQRLGLKDLAKHFK